jgi:geranyl-CoA carboxylase alpha subunit
LGTAGVTFTKVLVANRGEIARRVIRAVHALGYRSVAVFGAADASAPHVCDADEAVAIGPSPVRESYLSIPRIIDAARRTGADAIHPGYGFLSENAPFARACAEAGIVFIGPSPAAIEAMGEKRMAKEKAIAAGVPCAPGYMGNDQRAETMLREARRAGFPLLIKAAAGGGGRGMRIVREVSELDQKLASARSEAENAFGDGTLYLERLIERAHHIEVQIIADHYGAVLHLGERECSVQRRHQKVLEEAPSPIVDAKLRAELGSAAVRLASEIGYVGAGTVEFLVDGKRNFYFLEMNTRLQVEHPVTELTTGFDLVELQLKIAAGEPLAFSQDDVRFEGHAVEARLYAEDPRAGYVPQTGRVLRWEPASIAGVRFDTGIEEDSEVTSHYDPMLAKIIAHGKNRQDALRRLSRALLETTLLGVVTNREFLIDLLGDPAVRSGEVTTDYLDRRPTPAEAQTPEWLVAAAALLLCIPPDVSPAHWHQAGEAHWPLRLDCQGLLVTALVSRTREGDARISIGGSRHIVRPLGIDDGRLRIEVDGRVLKANFKRDGSEIWLQSGANSLHATDVSRQRASISDVQTAGSVRAPMTGRVTAVLIADGDDVAADTPIVVLEAMKMQMEIRAPRAGRVRNLSVTPNAQIDAGHLIAEIAELEGATR